jgi:hypothetical protein
LSRPAALQLAAIVALGLALAGCAGGSEPPTADPTLTSTSMPGADPVPADTTTPEAPVSDTTILITIGDTTVTGTLQQGAMTDSLLAQLPLELSFSDFGGQEWVATLPAPLSLDGMPEGSGAGPGAIGYYAPNQAFVLYYEEVGYYTGLVPFGTFTDLGALQAHAPAFTARITAG